MKAEVEIDTGSPDDYRQILEQSLTSNEKIGYSFETESEKLTIKVETQGLGQLRGCTDTIFRLSSLVNKVY